MRVLILSCNTGQGHNSCATAIQQVYEAHGDVCVIEDALDFISAKFSKFICWGHTTIYRHLPWLFRWGYSYSEKHPGLFKEQATIYNLLTCGTEKLYRYIADNHYEAVIGVHVFSALLLTAMQKKYCLNIKTAFLATDYTCSPIVQQSDLDKYFIPDRSLASQFICPNIPIEKLVYTGIPVRQMFLEKTDKSVAKLHFGIQENQAHLVIMCGSMGCGPIKKLSKLLSKDAGNNYVVTIVCGTNKKLQHTMCKIYAANPNIHVYGFVENIGLLLDSADLYLTKPGGLSVTEAAHKALPMVYIDAVAGCETHNCRYFVALGAAKRGKTPKQISAICLQLLKNPSSRAQMATALTNWNNFNPAEQIYHAMQDI